MFRRTGAPERFSARGAAAPFPMTERDPRREMESRQGLVFPSFRRTLVLFGRAFALRCPHCGKGPVLQHWLKLRVKCGA